MATGKMMTFSLGVLATLGMLSAQSWTQLRPAVSPSPRKGWGMAHDSARGRSVLFGMPHGSAVAETWEWNGAVWTKLGLAVQPPAREWPAMAYDSARSRVVLFGGELGGHGAGVLASDTWEFDGTAWLARSPATPPPARTESQMAFDSRRGRCVLFGGGVKPAVHPSGVSDDTWEWDGQQWTLVTPAKRPAGRQEAPMVYDSARGVVVMFGGLTANGYNGDTWEYDGVTWRQILPLAAPPATNGHGLAYDSARSRVVLTHGWANPIMTLETWEYDGVTWLKTTPALQPPGRYWLGFCYDPAAKKCLMFGGTQFGTNTHLGDTWAYTGPVPASFTAFGTGCGPILGAAPGSVPRIGSGFTARLLNLGSLPFAFMILGNSRTALGSLPLPLDLAAIGMPGCFLYTNQVLAGQLWNGQGTSTWTLSIPNVASYVGISLYIQGGVVSAVNPLGLVLSNAGELTIGY